MCDNDCIITWIFCQSSSLTLVHHQLVHLVHGGPEARAATGYLLWGLVYVSPLLSFCFSTFFSMSLTSCAFEATFMVTPSSQYHYDSCCSCIIHRRHKKMHDSKSWCVSTVLVQDFSQAWLWQCVNGWARKCIASPGTLMGCSFPISLYFCSLDLTWHFYTGKSMPLPTLFSSIIRSSFAGQYIPRQREGLVEQLPSIVSKN